MGKKKDNDKTLKAASPTKIAASAERKERKKVREAFRIVENLDNYRNRGAAKSRAGAGTERSSKKKSGGSGLRLRFGLDALISDSDTRAVKGESLQPGESRLVDIHITIPYVWKIPILGKKALSMVRKIQDQGYPESIRDILKSLRAKSPL